jgi:hypothetical protein
LAAAFAAAFFMGVGFVAVVIGIFAQDTLARYFL